MKILAGLVLILCKSIVFGNVIRPKNSTQAENEVVALFAGEGEEVCMKELGCFKITSDFISIWRPLNKLPHDRATINTRCLLYTRKNAKEPHQLVARDKESFTESNFDPKNPTKFIVHGFMDSEYYGPWMVRMKDELLMHDNYNIIIVDWSGGNKFPYVQATANTRVVGAEVALVIKALEKYTGIKREDCHIIGHSLGSHVAGYAGEILGGKIGRITGCDPADPYFRNMPTSVRLDPSDADFVDIIHSDASTIMFIGFGIGAPIGHVDFYPNNGLSQPGCRQDQFKSFITDGLNEGGRRFVSCNHQRSLDFFHHSINYRKVVPVAYECPSWEDFHAGRCAECGSDTSHCAIMGIRADEYYPHKNPSVQRSMYIKTSGKAPFWMYHYQVSVRLLKHSDSKDIKATMDVSLAGSKNEIVEHVQKEAREFYHGSTYKFLITTEKELGEIKSVSLTWHYKGGWTIWKPKMYVKSVTVQPMNVIEKSPYSSKNKVFCGNQNNGIVHDTKSFLERDDNCL